MEFKDKKVLITGGANGIGKAIAEDFRKEGAEVMIFDLVKNDDFTGDLSKKEDIEAFVKKAVSRFGKIDILVNDALPLMKGIHSCSYEEFEYAQKVGVIAPFYLAKLLLPYFTEGSVILNLSSSRSRMSEPETESYAAAKGGISALTHSLAMSLGPKTRVIAIAPGWIETRGRTYSLPDNAQQPVGRIGDAGGCRFLSPFPLLPEGLLHRRGRDPHRRRDEPSDDLSRG
jgi:NAD(P)-dependent dehydrogenase (short-subunit alcohol dehydrogenase family)